MHIVRLIHVKVPTDQMAKAEKIWREDCGPLMRESPGCISERLLKCLEEPGEYISCSEWDSEEAIEAYRVSDAHAEIQRHSRALQGAKAIVKSYSVIP
jgi:heme-degrading monooxygenase HmoA